MWWDTGKAEETEVTEEDELSQKLWTVTTLIFHCLADTCRCDLIRKSSQDLSAFCAKLKVSATVF